jgi:hypothetical protein
MTMRSRASRYELSDGVPEGGLQALQAIETVRDLENLDIVPVTRHAGGAVSAKEMMVAKVKWGNRVGYDVLTRTVPREFAPYNAIIRMRGTEDYLRDYLAYIVDEAV